MPTSNGCGMGAGCDFQCIALFEKLDLNLATHCRGGTCPTIEPFKTQPVSQLL